VWSVAAPSRRRFATVVLRDRGPPPDPVDCAIDELLGPVAEEELVLLMSRNVDAMTNAVFMPRLLARRDAADDADERTRISTVIEAALMFLEVFSKGVEELEPGLKSIEDEAEEAVAAIKAKSENVCRPRNVVPPRRSASASPESGKPSDKGDYDDDANESLRKNRKLVLQLLNRANAGIDGIDALLRAESEKLTPDFFAHLQWEIDQQRDAKNRRMLEILEVVVQRACREVEQKQPEEVAILAAVLQTKNSLVRREMYERELSRAAPALQAAFVALVNETLLQLEKALVRGESIDPSLLQQLRLIAAEIPDHMPTP
jgi:hypothetical protein